MRKFEILDKGNTHSKLTVTPDRVTVKLGKNEQFPHTIHQAAIAIAELITVDRAMRGVFDWNTQTITMESDVKSKDKITQVFKF